MNIANNCSVRRFDCEGLCQVCTKRVCVRVCVCMCVYVCVCACVRVCVCEVSLIIIRAQHTGREAGGDVAHINVFHDQVVVVLILKICLHLNYIRMVQQTHNVQLAKDNILKPKDFCLADDFQKEPLVGILLCAVLHLCIVPFPKGPTRLVQVSHTRQGRQHTCGARVV